MKNVIFSGSLLSLLPAILGMMACQAPNEKEESPVIVAIGDSFTMGIQDAGLLEAYQRSAYPFLIAKQLGGEAAFQQPYVSAPGIGVPPYKLPLDLTGSQIVADYWPLDAYGVPTVDPDVISIRLANLTCATPYNNLGVSGAKLHDLQNTTTMADSGSNFFFDIVLRNFSPPLPNLGGGKNIIQQAVLLDPDYILLWIGNNDILQTEFEGCGLNGNGITPFNDVPFETFRTEYGQVLTYLQENTHARILMANIPSWLPFAYGLDGIFRVDSRFPDGHLMLFDPDTFEPILFDLDLDGTGEACVPLLLEEADARHLLLTGATAYMELGKGIPNQTELEALGIDTTTAAAMITKMHERGIDPPATMSALPGTMTITAAENTAVLAILAEYNGIVAELGETCNIPVVDIAGDWWGADPATTTTPFGGYSGEFVLRAKDTTVFSLDGVHPNNLGQALCANSFIRVLNAEYGLDLDELAPASYAGQYSARAIDSRSLLRSIRGMAELP